MNKLNKNVKILLIGITFIATLFHDTLSMDKYWIVFTNKKGSTFDPCTYFTGETLGKYKTKKTSETDSTDFPLNQYYVQNILEISGDILHESRWLNAVLVKIEPEQKQLIESFSFTKEIIPSSVYSVYNNYKFSAGLTDNMVKLLEEQISSMKGNEFIENGIDGKGVRIAVFDGGFPGVDKSPIFEHLWKENRIIDYYDFVRNKKNVFACNKHGTMVLSCIAGMGEGKRMGLATGAEFLLARTEKMTEPFSEEKNWLAAAEWAYRNGADIINSSLGYTYHRYFPNEMDGRTSLVSKAANIAASKGILVVNAMGNDGDNRWYYVNTPADADSVLSVGGIDPNTGYHINFSSYGPTADKRRKPNLSALGKVVTSTKRKMQEAYGTSFSTPLVTGFAACVLQLNPGFSSMHLFHELEKSGELYPYYDYAHGYGIPQADYFLGEYVEPAITFDLQECNDTIKVLIKNPFLNSEENNYLYYHLENEKGYLNKYAVILVKQKEAFAWKREDLTGNMTLRVHYLGYTRDLNIYKNDSQ